MSITFPARYCENYNSALNKSELIKLVQATFEKLNWQHNLTNDEFQARISLNFWSFGEKLTVKIQGEGILICSKCVYPLQCFDWGKNKENVKLFLSRLEKMANKLLSDKSFQTVKSFDEKGRSPVERVFTESE